MLFLHEFFQHVIFCDYYRIRLSVYDKKVVTTMKYLLLSVALLTWLSVPVHAADSPLAQGLIEASGMGTVDMSKAKNRIQAKLLAKRAAVVDAQRNLLEMIEGVRVTSGTTVKDAQLESDVIANRVKGLLKGAFMIKENVTEDDGEFLAEVTLGICLNASVDQCAARPTLSQIIYTALEKPAPEQKFAAEPNAEAGTVSGLIVDASEVGFEPYFDVRLVTSQGKEVYGPGHFDVKAGDDWLHWSRSMTSAKENVKVIGSAPLIISAAALTGDANVVLSNDDAVKVFQANLQNGDFLRQGKVIFVVK